MPRDIDAKNFVANYELNDYRYSDFWAGREYEHGAEVILLKRLFAEYLPDMADRIVVDLGGAYGRLVPLYAPYSKQVILADYSTNELNDGMKRLKNEPYSAKLKYCALNAYKLPFKEESIDALLTVRVMHHLKTADIFMQQLARSLKPGGVAIIEFAHKNHALALWRNLLKGNLRKFRSEDILQVSHKNDSQGISEEHGQISIMYNFSIDYFRKSAIKHGLLVKGFFPCSFFRSAFFKKRFKLATLLKLEAFVQKFLGILTITPSIFMVVTKNGEFIPSETSFEHILACPTCGSAVAQKGEKIQCSQGHSFSQKFKEIVDLRDPRPEDINF